MRTPSRTLTALRAAAAALLGLAGLLLAAPASAKGTWEEQQARAEERSAEYQGQHPGVRSDRFVFKTVALPDGTRLDLDLRLVRPRTGGPFPVVFFVHGGAWATGSKAQFTHESYILAENGIAGVRLEYRWKSQGAKYPEAIRDVLDAIDYIRTRAREYGLDFSRVGLAGGSAGGHLSAMAAQLTPECICYDGYNGLFDVLDRGHSRFGGGDYTGTTDDEKKTASPIHCIKRPPPDTFIYHGTDDQTVDIDVARRFAAAIREAGGRARLLAYEGVGHAFFNKEPYQSATAMALLAHTSYVFGLTDKEPVPADHILPPKVTGMPDGFTVVGTWQEEGRPSRVFEFGGNAVAVSPAGRQLQWDSRHGGFHIIWRSGHRARIEVINGRTIRIGARTYIRTPQD